MALFCHDQYEHPLLWCNEKRKFEEQKIARASLNEVNRRKEIEREKKKKDVKEYREMITKHCPWGRPGGGAPQEFIRRGNILHEGLFPEYGNDCRKYTAPAYRNRMKLGGGGAPLRSASGRILTSYREDPLISFNDSNRKHVDVSLRYKASANHKMDYKAQLDKMVAEKDKIRRKTSMDVQKHDPWGKSGPGGMPWRHPGNIGKNFNASMGWTNQKLLEKIDNDANKSSNEGSIAIEPTDTKNDTDFKNQIPLCCCVNCCCNCGRSFAGFKQSLPKDIQNSHTHNSKTTVTAPKTENEPNNAVQRSEPKSKVTIGQTKQNGKNANHVKSKSEKYPRTRMCMITGGVELVPLLAKRRAMQRPISLSTTDVTKNPNINKFEESGHLDILSKQIKQKNRRIQIDKETDIKSTKKHFETLDSLWGRPGHGAPRPIKNKQNLNDLLYKIPFKAEYVL